MLNKHTTKFVKKLNKRLKKAQKNLILPSLIHVLLLTIVLLIVATLSSIAKGKTNK